MTLSTQKRIGWVAAATAAVAFVVAGGTVVGHPVPDENWGTRGAVLDIAFAIGLAGVAAALPALAAAVGVNRLGRIGVRVAQVGQLSMAVECVASTIHGGNTLGPVFMLGLLASCVGLLMLAVDGLRATGLRAIAPVPLLALLVGIAGGDHGGAIAMGVVWALLAVVIARGEQPAVDLQPAASR